MISKYCTTLLIAGVALSNSLYGASDKFDNKSAWRVKNGKLTEQTTGQHYGEKCLKATGKTQLISNKMYKVTPGKQYILSGWFKSTGSNPSKLYFGLCPFDKNKKQIYSKSVMVVPDTITVLAEACKPGDTVIKIKHGAKWKTHKYGVVAFKVDTTGEYNDLPNFNTTKILGITKIEDKNGIWELTLKGPCGRTFPADTPIREHISGSAYQYSATENQSVPKQWKNYTGKLKNRATINIPKDKFWPGTQYVKIIILANFRSKGDEAMLINGVNLVEE